MVLPLIPLALIVAGSATGGTGVIAGTRGAYKMHCAKKEAAAAVDEYETERQKTEQAAEAINARLREYGAQQDAAIREVVLRMAAFIRRNHRHVNDSLKVLVDGIEAEINECGEAEGLGPDSLRLLLGLAVAGTTGAGVAAGATGLVGTVGVASTGTSISALSGIAAKNATMAALGGGSLATGGGGMALGATALNFVTIGPALLIGGLVVNGQGEKALTQARKFVADARITQQEVAATRTVFDALRKRVEELSGLLDALVGRALQALAALERVESTGGGFEPQRDALIFQEAIGLTVAVRDVAATPVLDESGSLNERTASLKVKYKEFLDDAE